MGVIERVDQQDEALGWIAVARRQDGDLLDEHRTEFSRDGEIVRRPQRRFAQIGERKTGGAMCRLRNDELSSQHVERSPLASVRVGEPFP